MCQLLGKDINMLGGEKWAQRAGQHTNTSSKATGTYKGLEDHSGPPVVRQDERLKTWPRVRVCIMHRVNQEEQTVIQPLFDLSATPAGVR